MISIVIPTYNRGTHLKKVTKMLVNHMLQMGEIFELIYVDDCSKDHTAAVLQDIVSEYVQVRAIILEENCGQQNATLAGIRTARGELVMTMDDDLRYGLTGIMDMLAMVDNGFEVVYGNAGEQDNGMTRRVGTVLKESLFRWLCHKPKGIQLTSFRVMQRSVVDYICTDDAQVVYISARLLNHTKNITSVQVKSHEALDLPTNYTFKKLGNILFEVFRNYTTVGKRLHLHRAGQQYRVKESYR